MNKITETILNKIKTQHLKPMPKWRFRLSNSGRWLGLIVLVSVMILSLGLLWYFWSDQPCFYGGRLDAGLIFGRMPLLFLMLIFLGAVFSLFDFYNTGRGYKYSFLRVSLVLLVVVVLAGWSFNYFGLSQKADKILGSSSVYQSRDDFMKDIWQNPKNGLVAGEIISIINSNSFILKDLDEKQWIVNYSGAIWRHGLRPEIGLEIKMIGLVNDVNFIAQDIRPWIGSGECRMSHELNSCGVIK
ncbi:MAG: hypothetical protein WCL61_03820 [bacterium]